ncbi:Tc toxin subunit A [Morganella morganii]|uniref:Tc toxin subunit A n=1 Tax=Morganella morganii TaxID=582 RepID=UPI001F190D0B|nr:Tc toxin subunit A [Morganella morganii]MCF1266151.1 Tc toxin subunit A [Morganella morganii]
MGTDKHNLLFSRIIDQSLPGLSDNLSAKKAEKSVITRLKEGTKGLMADYPGLGYPDAKMLHNRVAVAVRAVVRKQRELRQLNVLRAPREEKGLKALTRQLTYEDQFSPNWAENTLPDAIDSGHGAVAYLYELLDFTENVIEPKGDSDKAITLKQRRPDIYNILLNEENVNGNISKIHIINKIISTAISQQENGEDPEKLMLNVRYPYQFPFENYLNQIYAVLDEYDLSIGDIKRRCDMEAPYFTQPGLHGKHSDSALWLDSHLGPGLRDILLAVPQIKNSQTEDNTRYFKQNFGIEQFTDLLNTTVFCQQLKLERSDLESLFSCGEYVPHLSPNVDLKTVVAYVGEQGREVSPAVYGSVFINSNTSPAMKTGSDTDAGEHTFSHMDESRCERIERFLRLSRALNLPYEELDKLLTSVIRAEHNQEDKNLIITGTTLRAIGLFVSLNRKLKCTVSQFSVLYDGIAVYSRGKDISDFDRLFNNDDRFGYRFILDDKKMEERDINRICSVFGINYDTFSYLALVTREVLGLDTLTRSRNVISAIYRPVVLANLLKIKPLELLALLKSMNPDAQFDRLFTGIPENRVYNAFEQADITSAISALVSIHTWRTENNLSVAQIFNWITPAIVDEQEDNTEQELFRQIKENTNSTLFSNEALYMAGVPKGIDWVLELQVLVSEQGILRDTADGLDWDSYKANSLTTITSVVDNKLSSIVSEERKIVINTILSVLLEKRTAQWKSVSGLLEGYLGNKTDSITPALYWCGSNTESFLTAIRSLPDNKTLSEDDSQIMTLLSGLRRYGEIITHFRLEPAMMSQLLSHDNNNWYELKTEKPTLQLLYRLSVYRQLIDDGKQPAEKLLNYLSLINSLSINRSSSDEIRLYRDQALNKLSLFMGWSINELLTAAQYVEPENAIIRTLPQLLLVKQIHSVCLKTGLSARSVISLFNLNEDSESSLYQSVADQVMESLASQDVSLYSNDESSQGDLTVSVSAGQTTLLVYSKNQEEEDEVAEDETQLTVTLLTLESTPLEGVSVSWEKISEQGELSATKTTTDKSGRASVTLKAGLKQGVALIKAHYGVKSVPLPLIRIDCDSSTLGATNIETVPEEPIAIPADGKTSVKIIVHFSDSYDNPGIDKNVRWETTGGRFIYKGGITDDDGKCYATLVSDEPADITVRAFYEGMPDDYSEADISFI